MNRITRISLNLAWGLFFGMSLGWAQQSQTGFDRWQVSLSGGYGYRPAKLNANVPSEFVSYAKKLKSGWVLDGTAYYFLNPKLGLGLHANRFASSNSIADVYVTDVYGNTQYGTMSDNISITFVGPGAVFRQTFSDGNTFLAGASLGYVGYLNRFEIITTQRIKGATAGYIAHVGYDIRLSDHLSIGAKIAATTGILGRFTVDGNEMELDDENKENLGHIDIALGIRFH
ncbi:hypothetical protein [Parapedobacter sp. 10938]|uniref:hypothetical protein n=1 Tax=Parapedobacter flavus TaxID=3110225 RepID=UPI002DBEB4FA|nr:hypothetical protein [Parapedobacter sp. 10938]MEC3878639.1 hypothetical protein [Parapedobacter sp. 10938]